MKRSDAIERKLPSLGSRREFLTRVGQAGGYSAAFSAMHALGLMFAPAAKSEVLNIPIGSGGGVKVAILGGGIAGLVSAYELGKAGYACTVLEARSRPGGRNWTVRGGTKVEFTDGLTQSSEWGLDSYLNAGPARLPSIHKTILGYCNELGVPLEVEVNSSRSSLLVNAGAFGGKPVEQRQAINDTRGHVAELLAKCINQHALDQQLTAEDHERILEFLRIYGDLNREYSYTVPRAPASPSFPGPVRFAKNCGRRSRCTHCSTQISGAGCYSRKRSTCKPRCFSRWEAWIAFLTRSRKSWAR